MLEHAAWARLEANGRLQVVEVAVRGGYRPDAIVARAGVPLRILFRRDDEDACSERVVFSSPRLDRRLARRGVTGVDLPPQPAGEIRFTCGMGRYRGRIALVDQARGSVLAELRQRASHVEAPVGTALVLWLCSLPLIAIAAVVFLDGAAALGVAALALVGWLAACLWAFRASAPSTERDEVLSRRSDGSQSVRAVSGDEAHASASNPNRNETPHHDEHRSHSCH